MLKSQSNLHHKKSEQRIYTENLILVKGYLDEIQEPARYIWQ